MKKNYKQVGIGLLIASILIFIVQGYPRFLLVMVISLLEISSYTDPSTFLYNLLKNSSTYELIILFSKIVLDTILIIWTFCISISLIKKDKYTKKLLYLFYALIGINLLYFVLAIFLGKFIIVNLLVATFVYFFLIYRDNKWSRLIKNK